MEDIEKKIRKTEGFIQFSEYKIKNNPWNVDNKNDELYKGIKNARKYINKLKRILKGKYDHKTTI
jgi:hypothetical protein